MRPAVTTSDPMRPDEIHFGQSSTDLEVKDDGPDEAQRQLRVAIHYVLGSDVHQFNLKHSHQVFSRRQGEANPPNGSHCDI